MTPFKKILLAQGMLAREMISRGVSRHEALNEAAQLVKTFSSVPGDTLDILARLGPSFALAWAESAFSCIEPSHKLAASLMCTSVPKEYADELRLPWRCFMITVPSGLLTEDAHLLVLQPKESSEIRILQVGTKAVTVWFEGSLGGFADYQVQDTLGDFDAFGGIEHNSRVSRLLGRLLIGVICELTRSELASKVAERGQDRSKTSRSGEPKAWAFKLGRPIHLDVRGAVRDYLRDGRVTRNGPQVQTLVRGYFKHQPHGPRNSLRRYQHVEPAWRGPEDAPIIVRPHRK
jgi:hypothetical protein